MIMPGNPAGARLYKVLGQLAQPEKIISRPASEWRARVSRSRVPLLDWILNVEGGADSFARDPDAVSASGDDDGDAAVSGSRSMNAVANDDPLSLRHVRQ